MPRTAPAPNIPAIPGMNPGAFVMGGGGGGGGGSGKGGDGSGGEQGADGQDGGDGADGAGGGAGNCGTGSQGACTNCSNNPSGGDPVDILTGAVFTHPVRELFMPGAFNLRIDRRYSSRQTERDIGLGPGWTHSLAWSIRERRQRVEVYTGDNREVVMPVLRKAGATATMGPWGIRRLADGYAVRPGNEFIHFFEPSEERGRYRLSRVKFRDRGNITLQYERDRLVRALDSVGRIVLFQRHTSGHIASISVPSDSGHTLTFARYRYDEHGKLIAATNADGHTTLYDYEADRLTRVEHPSGLVVHFRYDEEGRCIETWGMPRSGRELALAPGLDEVLADRHTPAKGIYHTVINHYEGLHEAIDARGIRRIEGDGIGASLAVDGNGSVTTRVRDERGRTIQHADANGSATTYQYDALDRVTVEVDGEGVQTAAEYDGAGRLTAAVDGEGGQIQVERNRAGEVVAIRDQEGAMSTFEVDARGSTLRARDPDGAERRYEYDRHANRVAIHLPEGGVMRFTYDHWGRRLTEVDPMGGRHLFTYLPSGRLASITDGLGRTRRREYDAMGNLSVETRPDGATTVATYGGLNWLHKVRYADGSEIRYEYDREGLPLALHDEAGRRYELEWDAAGRLVGERDYSGRWRRYGLDAVGRVSWIDAGDGKRMIERDAVGRVIKEVGESGSELTLAYNGRGEVIEAIVDDNKLNFVRDKTGRVITERHTIGREVYEVQSERQPGGRRVEMRTSLGHSVAVSRDLNGQVRRMDVDGRPLVSIERDAFGMPRCEQLADGGQILKEYDASQRLRRRQIVERGATDGSDEPERLALGGEGRLEQLFDYTAADEVAEKLSSDGQTLKLEYDLRRRLTKRESEAGIERFRADGVDNYFSDDAEPRTRVYGPNGEVLADGSEQLVYDDQGRLSERRELGPDGEVKRVVARYTWNDWGLLAQVTLWDGRRVEYDYDAFARRIAKRVVADDVMRQRHYVWDLTTMVHERGVDDEALETYLYEDHDNPHILAQKKRDAWRWIVPGVSGGMPERLVDLAGRTIERFDFDAFGRPRGEPGLPTPFRFLGQQYDADIGLHYNRYRYYDPKIGRYISPDPTRLRGGLHPYAYGPNPVGWVDPMGWQHELYVLGFPHEHVQSGEHDGGSVDGLPISYYESGAGADALCPAELRNTFCRSRTAHTEQKFCHDLLASGERGGSYSLIGERPPCPNCHGAMLRTSQAADAEITYSWGNNHITYQGGSVQSHSGPDADFLINGDVDGDGNPFGGRYSADNFELTANHTVDITSDPEQDFTQADNPADYWGFEQEGAGGDYLAVNP